MGRLWGDKKNQDTFADQLFWPLRGPPILACCMRPVLYLFYFHGFKKVTIFNEKTEIREYFLRVLVAQSSCKIAPNHLGGDQKNQELIIQFFHLREVGPSRKILHARGVGSERRKRVERKDGSWVALGTTRKIKIPSLISYFCRSRDRLFWVPVCALSCISFIFMFSRKRLFLLNHVHIH